MGGDSRVRGCEKPWLLTTEMELIIPAPGAGRGRWAQAKGYSSAVRSVGTRGRRHLSPHLRIRARPGIEPRPHWAISLCNHSNPDVRYYADPFVSDEKTEVSREPEIIQLASDRGNKTPDWAGLILKLMV